MTPDLNVLVSIEDSDTAAANHLAGDLRAALVDDGEVEAITVVRDDPLSQDFGVTLGIILGSQAITALATGVAKWLTRHQGTRIKVRRTLPTGEQRELTIAGEPSERAERMLQGFLAD